MTSRAEDEVMTMTSPWAWARSSANRPPKICQVAGCDNEADPRWSIHGADGGRLPACDGHSELPCLAVYANECKCPKRKRDQDSEETP